MASSQLPKLLLETTPAISRATGGEVWQLSGPNIRRILSAKSRSHVGAWVPVLVTESGNSGENGCPLDSLTIHVYVDKVNTVGHKHFLSTLHVYVGFSLLLKLHTNPLGADRLFYL